MKKLVVFVLMLSLVLLVLGCGEQKTVEEEKTVQEEMKTSEPDCVSAVADCTKAPEPEETPEEK